jgi:hypothetical protein
MHQLEVSTTTQMTFLKRKQFKSHLHPKGYQSGEKSNSNTHPFTGHMTGKRQNVAPHINRDVTQYSVFMLYFAAVNTLLVKETNSGPSTIPDVTESETFPFLAIIILKELDMRESL